MYDIYFLVFSEKDAECRKLVLESWFSKNSLNKVFEWGYINSKIKIKTNEIVHRTKNNQGSESSETFSRSCNNLNLDIRTVHTHTHTEESNFIYLVIWNCDLKSKHVLYEDRDQTFRSHFSRVELSLIGLEQIRSSGDLRESTLWRSFCHQSNKKKFVIANQFTKHKKKFWQWHTDLNIC